MLHINTCGYTNFTHTRTYTHTNIQQTILLKMSAAVQNSPAHTNTHTNNKFVIQSGYIWAASSLSQLLWYREEVKEHSGGGTGDKVVFFVSGVTTHACVPSKQLTQVVSGHLKQRTLSELKAGVGRSLNVPLWVVTLMKFYLGRSTTDYLHMYLRFLFSVECSDTSGLNVQC